MATGTLSLKKEKEECLLQRYLTSPTNYLPIALLRFARKDSPLLIAYCLLTITIYPSRNSHVISPFLDNGGHIFRKIGIEKYFFAGVRVYKS